MKNDGTLPSAEDSKIAARFDELGIRRLLLTMVDHAGISRVKVLPRGRLGTAVRHGLGFSLTSAVLLCSDDSLASLPRYPVGLGDVRLFADLDSARLLDAETGTGWAPADQRTPEGAVFELCQRTALARQVERLLGLGLDLQMAFEFEFTVFRAATDGNVVPAHQGPAYGLGPVLHLHSWIDEILDACELAGIEVEQFHPEYADGQYEISVRPSTPVAAVDTYLLTRLIVLRACERHGLRVSFAPLSHTDGVGNGCHVHLSARDGTGNVFDGSEHDTTMRSPGEHMTAGLVDYLPQITGMLAPSVNSYQRLQPGRFSGGFACWGLENREAAVRYIPGTTGRRAEGANLEIKTPDGTANPYLAAAAILVAAGAGLADRVPLPAGVDGIPESQDAGAMQRSRTRRLPDDLEVALTMVESSAVLRGQLGDAMVETFVGVRRREWVAYGQLPLEERIALLRWVH